MLWTLGAAGAGWFALSLGARPTVSRIDRAIGALPVGLLLTSVILFLANLLFHIPITRWSVLAAVIGLDAILIVSVVLVKRPDQLWSERRSLRASWSELDVQSRWLLAVAALVMLTSVSVLVAIKLSAPLEGWDFYSYHWHYTRVVVETGSLPTHAAPTIMESQYAYPPLLFIVYAQISVLLGGLSQIGPRLVPLLFAVSTILVGGRIAFTCLRLSLPASLVAAGFTAWKGDFYNAALLQENTDTAGAFFTVAAVLWLLRRDVGPAPRIVGTGIFLAGAYWTRYNGLTLFLVIAAMQAFAVIWSRRQRSDWRRELLVGVGALALGALLIAPHLVRNLAMWGNPLYPAFARVVGGYLVDPWVLHNVLPYSTPSPLAGLPPDWWIHPLSTFAATGPVLALTAVALPLAIARLKHGDAGAAQLGLAAVLYFACYLLFMRVADDGDSDRHLLAMVALAAPLIGLIFDTITARTTAGAAAALASVLLLAWFVLSNYHSQWGAINAALLLIVLVLAVMTYAPSLGARLRRHGRFDLVVAFMLPFVVIVVASQQPQTSVFAAGGLEQLPESAILRGLPPSAHYLTFDNRVELLGGRPMSADDPALEHFYQAQLSGIDGINELKHLGIVDIYWSIPPVGTTYPRNPLVFKSPLYAELDDPALFDRVFFRQDASGGAAIYALR